MLLPLPLPPLFLLLFVADAIFACYIFAVEAKGANLVAKAATDPTGIC